MPNENLQNAKKARNDEFYTQYADIQKEINAYLEYNPDVFRGKTVLLPCDDPEWSNFTMHFAQNFEAFGLKKLISTSYANTSKQVVFDWNPPPFETSSPEYDPSKTRVRGKIFVLDHDTNQNGRIDLDDLEYSYLEEDGGFRSPEVTRLRDEVLDKYCPEQFEILDARDYTSQSRLKSKNTFLVKDADGSMDGTPTYVRVLIRHIPQPEK